jgi:hypothetical protein
MTSVEKLFNMKKHPLFLESAFQRNIQFLDLLD